ncbi:MAG: sensor histidine kinase, partial [Gaiellaceae bacterium]
VKRRLVYAAVIALAIALAVGFVAARMFAQRIHRLERAADRIAAGQFDEPLVDKAEDELGELARAFDRMRERLAQLEHARREFIANASHELRTPLFSLGGHLELLDDEDLDEPTRREFLSRMREQVDRLTKLAAELLDLSRLDAGRLHVERAPVDLSRVADLLLEEFEPVARSSDHVLELSENGEAPALGDEQRVLQIGRALVENAIRHTPPGTRVRIHTSRHNGLAVLAVEDDGPGIAPDHASHVFERFYRADGALASGSGLGLAIARELAEVMEGEIDLDSRPGRTVFRVSLPSSQLSR